MQVSFIIPLYNGLAFAPIVTNATNAQVIVSSGATVGLPMMVGGGDTTDAEEERRRGDPALVLR